MNLEIKEGNTDGRWFSQTKLDRLKDLAEELSRLPGLMLTEVEVFYEPVGDWHFLEFCLDGHTYHVRYYKVFSLHKDCPDAAGGDGMGIFNNRVDFGSSECAVFYFFQGGRHKTMEVDFKSRF